MGFNRYRPHTFYFDYDLERGDECLLVEVSYTIDDDDLCIQSVQYNGAELETSTAEDEELLNEARLRVNEDMADAEADYGDYLYDLRRDQED